MKGSRCGFVVACLLLLGGCGTDLYEQRLRETNAFFEYRQSLDRVLQGFWEDRDTSIRLRIPKGFARLPRPAVPKEGEPFPVDSRHPLVFNQLTLPGLVEAWRGDFAGDDGQLRPALLYVCSNHSLFHQPVDQAVIPSDGFKPAIETMVGQAFGVQLVDSTEIRDNTLYREICPRDPKYAVQKPFSAASIVPPAGYTNEPLGFLPKCQLYTHENGKIQVAVILIYAANTQDRLDDRLLTALETFSVSNQIPKATRAGGPVMGGNAPKF